MRPEAKTVTLKITGDSSENLSIELEIRSTNNNRLITDPFSCGLSPLPPKLLATYTDWRDNYRTWNRTPRTMQPNNQERSTVNSSTEQLIKEFNDWLSTSNEFARIRENILAHVSPQEYRNRPELLSLVVQTCTANPDLNLNLQRLPWNEWEFISRQYRTGVALSTNRKKIVPQTEGNFRALAIFGYYYNDSVDLTRDLLALQQNLSGRVDLETWICDCPQRSRTRLLEKLNTETYHLLFFSGHSAEDHRIQLNDNEYILTNNRQFKQVLENLRERGLILAFFNSCDGLGIASDLMSVGIPYIVAMKESIPDSVAQDFIQKFLVKAVEQGVPIHVAVNKAREDLQWNGLSHSSFLPALFQNPEQPPFYLTPVPPVQQGKQVPPVPPNSLFHRLLPFLTFLLLLSSIGGVIYLNQKIIEKEKEKKLRKMKNQLWKINQIPRPLIQNKKILLGNGFIQWR